MPESIAVIAGAETWGGQRERDYFTRRLVDPLGATPRRHFSVIRPARRVARGLGATGGASLSTAVQKLQNASNNIKSTWEHGWIIKEQAVALAEHGQAVRDKATWKKAKDLWAEGDRIVKVAATQGGENDRLRNNLYQDISESDKAGLDPEVVHFLTGKAGLPPPSGTRRFPRDAAGLGIAPIILIPTIIVGLVGIGISLSLMNKIASHFDGSANSTEYSKQLAARNQAVLDQIKAGASPKEAEAANPPPPKPAGALPLRTIAIAGGVAVALIIVGPPLIAKWTR